MGTLFAIIVLIVVIGLIYWLITLLPIDARFKQIILVILVIFCILVLLGFLFGGVAVPGIRLPVLR